MLRIGPCGTSAFKREAEKELVKRQQDCKTGEKRVMTTRGKGEAVTA